MKLALVVLALAMVHTAYASGWFGRGERKVIDSYNNDPEGMDVKNIKVVDPKPWPKPYGGPKHEGAYESGPKPKYSAPKYEKDDDDEYFGGRGSNRAVARALDDDDDDLYAPLYGYGVPYGGYGAYDRDNNRNRNRNRNANANANANRDENNSRNGNNVKSKNAVEDAIYVIYLLNLYINLEC